MSLFHPGKELFEEFGLSLESEIGFTDYTKNQIFVYKDIIKFTCKSLMFCHPKPTYRGEEFFIDDWIESEEVEFYSWDNVLSFENVKGSKILEEFDKLQIDKWLSTIKDPQLEYPYINVKQGHIAFIDIGIPKSRSKRGKIRSKKEVEAKRGEIEQLYPRPFSKNVEMKIDVFIGDVDAIRPDVDRLSIPIADAFKGVAYKDDKQIRYLRPRIIDVSQAFTKLECRTHPMDHFSMPDNIPAGF